MIRCCLKLINNTGYAPVFFISFETVFAPLYFIPSLSLLFEIVPHYFVSLLFETTSSQFPNHQTQHKQKLRAPKRSCKKEFPNKKPIISTNLTTQFHHIITHHIRHNIKLWHSSNSHNNTFT